MGRRAFTGHRGRARGRSGAPIAAGLGVGAALRCQAPGTLDSGGMDKALTPKRAPGGPGAEPGLVKKLTQKEKKKKRFWKNKAREVDDKPGSNPQVVAVRPPKAPEDFSQNWKALQELLKQKPQAPEKPMVISQMDSKRQAKFNQNKKSKERGDGDRKNRPSGHRRLCSSRIPEEQEGASTSYKSQWSRAQ